MYNILLLFQALLFRNLYDYVHDSNCYGRANETYMRLLKYEKIYRKNNPTLTLNTRKVFLKFCLYLKMEAEK